MIMGLQIIGIVFGILMAYFTFLNFKKKEFEKTQFIFWEILWICFIFITLFPNIISEFSKNLGFIRVMDFLTIIGFIFIAFLSFYNYSSINIINKKIEKIVREEAITKSLKK